MDINLLQNLLYRGGYLLQSQISGEDDINTKSAVKQFQTDNGLTATGNVDTKTYDALIYQIAFENDDASDTPINETPVIDYESIKNKPFFNRDGTFRTNNVPIRIEYGPNKTLKKTITNVHFRSAGQEVDGSGNPIFEIIEFIGRDIKEE